MVYADEKMSTEAVAKEENTQVTTDKENTTDKEIIESTTQSETTTVGENTTEEITTEETTVEETTTESTTQENTTKQEETTTKSDKPAKTYVLTVTSRTISMDVANKLENAGIIDDADEFNDYLCDNGYSSNIQNGKFTITSDMSYREIAEIITSSPKN